MTMEQLVETLIQKFGWQLESHRPEAVERALHTRLLKLGQTELTPYLQQLRPGSPEFNLLLEELVVPESWFYRERETLSLLVEKLSQANHSKHNPLRILCIPCARGEEPSTMAMMLHQAGWQKELHTIDAIDLSLAAIESAKTGLYRGHSFRGTQTQFRKQFFCEVVHDASTTAEVEPAEIQKIGVWQLDPAITKSINYSVENIFELPETYRGYDIILCRHLLIYLTPEARERLFEIVASRLKANGLFAVAACEFALPPAQRFDPILREGIVIFRNQPAPQPPGSLQSARADKPPLLHSKPTNALHKNHSKDRHSLRSPARLLPSQAATASSSTRPEPTTSLSLLEQAKQEADLGRLHEAITLCQQVLAAKPSAEAYCLHGLISGALNEKEASEASFRKALYLEPDNREALTQLALAKEAAGEHEAAKRLRERLNR